MAKTISLHPKIRRKGRLLDIDLDNTEDQDSVISFLEKADPSDPKENLAAANSQLELFG